MLAAKAMGYDSCPMDGFDFDKVGELINLPEDHSIAMFVAVGKGTKEPWARPGRSDTRRRSSRTVFRSPAPPGADHLLRMPRI